MEKRDRRNGDPSGLSDAFCEFVLEASNDELAEVLKEVGEDPNTLTERGRWIASAALQEFGRRQEARRRESELVKVLHEGLGTLVQLLRRQGGLTQGDLASAARIDVSEVRAIEADPSFEPNPRTVFQLEKYFQLPERTLVKLSGVTTSANTELAEEVMRFAADAKAMTVLSKPEKKLVNEFVKFLSTWSGKGK